MKGTIGPTHIALEVSMLLMCRQDPLMAVTLEGSSWSKARNIGMLEINILGTQFDAAKKIME